MASSNDNNNNTNNNTNNMNINDNENVPRISSSLYATVSDEEKEAESHTLTHNNRSAQMKTAASNESIEMTNTAYYDQSSPRHNNGDTNGTDDNGTNLDPTPNPNQTQNRSAEPISLTELSFGIASYHVIVLPVTLTMFLSALAVTYIQSPLIDTSSELNERYNVFKTSDDYSVGRNIGLSLVNALVMVSVIAVATFGLVLLYKYRCMKCLFGYMIFASAALLGLLGSVVSLVAIQRYQIPIDKITFYFFMFNFAIVGTMSIFYSRGIPTYVTQVYLVLTSVILAWQLSQFNDWTAWCLLVMLALYDLCAVLTPCGPLKALIRLMSKDGAPTLPGLLYEAQLPNGVERPNMNNGNSDNSNNSNNHRSGESGSNNQGQRSNQRQNESQNEHESRRKRKDRNKTRHQEQTVNHSTTTAKNDQQLQQQVQQQPQRNHPQTNLQQYENNTSTNNDNTTTTHKTGVLPLAIAIIYKLPIQSPPEYVVHDFASLPPPSVRRSQYSPAELTSMVIVRFPRSGGYIEALDAPFEESPSVTNEDSSRRSFFGRNKKRNSQQRPTTQPRYIVYDRHGNIKRELVVNEEGRIFEAIKDDGSGNNGNGGSSLASNSIKLGLGDFIFYSVLVSKAAQYSFTTFAACVLVILAGLGGTLVLLSVYRTALPALPISIFLGVSFYFLTRGVIEPFLIEEVFQSPIYV